VVRVAGRTFPSGCMGVRLCAREGFCIYPDHPDHGV